MILVRRAPLLYPSLENERLEVLPAVCVQYVILRTQVNVSVSDRVTTMEIHLQSQRSALHKVNIHLMCDVETQIHNAICLSS